MLIQTINTIETSSVCDNTCPYCPAPFQHMFRKTGFMTWNVYEKAIKWALALARQRQQKELNLFGIGEPLLNPEIVDMVRYARQHLPITQVLHINTNGNHLTEKRARELYEAGVNQIDLTIHQNHAVAARSILILKKIGKPFNISLDPVLHPNNWAGQVDWFPAQQKVPCPWIPRGQVTIQSNGDVTVCCWDCKCTGKLGTVDDNLLELEVKPFLLCETCHQTL